MLNFILVTTKHLKSGVLFHDEDDYRAAMNIVAICAFVTGVRVISFILMSNHVHFVLMGSEAEGRIFIDKFKTLYGKYYFLKYGVHEYLRHLAVDFREVRIEDESLPRSIAYVQMNCGAANLVPSAFLYPWGTGQTFFSALPLTGQRLLNFSRRKQYRILRTRMDLPQDYLLGESGYILPLSYVEVQFVEQLFGSPSRYSFFLNTSSKAKLRLDKSRAPSFPDHIAKGVLDSLVLSLFRAPSFSILDANDKVEALTQLQRRLNLESKQLSRLSGIREEEIVQMLDTFS